MSMSSKWQPGQLLFAGFEGLELPEDAEFDTVGGFVLAELGRVPEVGDSLEANDARFTALAATPTHVQRLGIELLRPARSNGEKRR